MPCSEKMLCIKCNEDGNLLACADNDCPLAIHKKCMGCQARFDDEGRFYCPYCWYRQSVAESRRAMEHMVSRKKALLIFMDDNDKGCDDRLNKDAENANGYDDGLNKDAGNANLMESDGGTTREDDNDGIVKSPHVEEHKIGGSDEETTLEDESEAFEDQIPIIKMHLEENNENTEETSVEEDDPSQIGNSGVKMIQEDPSHVVHGDEQEEEKEEDDSAQEGHETLNVSSSEEGPSKIVPASSKRGSKRKGSTETGSKAIKLEAKEAKTSDKKKKKLLPLTPTRRSSRKLSSTPLKGKLSK